MANDQKMLADLRKCMRDANGDAGAMTVCENTFKAAGGKTKQDGGKVFSTPDGSAAFVTNGGKVF